MSWNSLKILKKSNIRLNGDERGRVKMPSKPYIKRLIRQNGDVGKSFLINL